MNDNAVAVKEASVRELVEIQAEIINKTNELLDEFLANTQNSNEKDNCGNSDISVGCFMDELRYNEQKLKSAYAKLEAVCRIFYG
jgi:hypothetical protein